MYQKFHYFIQFFLSISLILIKIFLKNNIHHQICLLPLHFNHYSKLIQPFKNSFYLEFACLFIPSLIFLNEHLLFFYQFFLIAHDINPCIHHNFILIRFLLYFLCLLIFFAIFGLVSLNIILPNPFFLRFYHWIFHNFQINVIQLVSVQQCLHLQLIIFLYLPH